jgi:glutamine synthetase
MPQFADFEPARRWLGQHPRVRFVDLLLPDQLGIPRGKRVTAAELETVHDSGLLLPASMFALDVLGGTVQSTGLVSTRATPTASACRSPDPRTGAMAGRRVRPDAGAMYEHDRQPFAGDPRHVLEHVLERFTAAALTPVVAVELEFYLVDRERTVDGLAQPPRQPLSGRREYRTQINSMADLSEYTAVLSAIDAAARAQDVPSGTVLAEYGPGQFEVNLHHTDALAACDHAIRLKRLIKGVALQHGMDATFMAKPYREQAGSGAHLHVSMLDTQGRNIFAADEPRGSARLTHAIGGLAATLNESMALFAPNRELVPALSTRSVRAAECELGGQQPRRRVSRTA